jgi:preprotein translocase subunit SecA
MKAIFEKVFGSQSRREIKRIMPIVEKIEALESEMQNLSDEALKNKTNEFKEALKAGKTLDDIQVEAFAVAKEAARRVLGLNAYKVQVIGGIVLHQGNIAEMKTGEGKTLMATLPVYLNALEGKGVHVVTVNDYLAKRDMEWMGKVYKFLGLSVSCIVHGITPNERVEAYKADVTYGTNNEFGFDYLRDNMVIFKEERVQRPLNYAIIDEVDSILIDEARTPLIISGAGEKSTELYERADDFVKTLKGRFIKPEEELGKKFEFEYKEEEADFTIDEKARSVTISEKGVEKAERYFGIENMAESENMELSHHINQALKARYLMHKDKDYVLKDGEIIIVDDFTGRLMYGRRYSEGLHQAIEAKEKLEVRRESKTLATITFQNYFRMYNKLAGMTGTAMTEEEEFRHIYNMNVIEIPTNKPIQRNDMHDVVYKNRKGKYNAVIEEIEQFHKMGRPILVGTISIEDSEYISKLLKRTGIPHEVLNAKHHEREAEIVAQAGKFGGVTIATNMAGRGTDIVLGGNADFVAKSEMRRKGYSEHIIALAEGISDTNDPEVIEARELFNRIKNETKDNLKSENRKVIEAGGLHIIGTERHESRRIDNQLRGRSGRQGDPGSSRFFLSLEDDLVRLFGGERVMMMMENLGLPEDQPIEAKILSRTIENAQKKVEMRNFGIRKHVLQYDDVMNKQREVIYKERVRVLEGENLKDHVLNMSSQAVDGAIEQYTDGFKYPEEWNIDGLLKYINNIYSVDNVSFDRNQEDLDKEYLKETCNAAIAEYYEEKEKEITSDRMREIERIILLRTVDTKWMDHIDAMDQLRQGISLRAMGNEDPVRAYQNEGYDMFNELIQSIQEDTLRSLFHVRIDNQLERKKVAKINEPQGDSTAKPVVKKKKIGRNDPCPCGSGKKYKKCCGMNE